MSNVRELVESSGIDGLQTHGNRLGESSGVGPTLQTESFAVHNATAKLTPAHVRTLPSVSSAQWSALSLFSGCGGLDLGFHEQGFRTIAAYDLDRLANATYSQNIMLSPRQVDLARFGPPIESADVVLAGAPCQGFSTMGKRSVDDPRNALVLRAAQIAVAIRPRVLVIENVPAALSGAHARIWTEAEALLRSRGYNVRRYIAEGVESGVPQRRRRLFLICWRGSDCIRVAPDAVAGPRLREALSNLEQSADHDPIMLPIGSRDEIIASAIAPGSKLCNVRISDTAVPTWSIPGVFGKTTCSQREVLVALVRLRRRDRRRNFGDADPVLPSHIASFLGRPVDADIAALTKLGYLRCLVPYVDITHTYNGKFRRLDWRAPSPTVDTHFGDPRLFLHPTESRGLTPREAARIQGFPDAFTFLGGRRERFELIGNAVPPPMAARIAAFIRRALL
jgi:DNA (cytosine-5)-methyltransferase 1